MPDTAALEHVAQTMERTQRHWQERQRLAPAPTTFPPKAAGLTIALTREAGTGGMAVGQEVATRLDWPVYDHELLELLAKEMGLRVSLLESIDERRRSWLLECVEAFSLEPSVTESAYVRHLVETILSLGAHGECVIVGRGAALILPPETTLRVRLVADRENRIAALIESQNLTRREAETKVDEIGRERVRFMKEHFQKDPTEPHHYDLILNTSRWSAPDCADLIVEAYQRLWQKTTGQ